MHPKTPKKPSSPVKIPRGTIQQVDMRIGSSLFTLQQPYRKIKLMTYPQDTPSLTYFVDIGGGGGDKNHLTSTILDLSASYLMRLVRCTLNDPHPKKRDRCGLHMMRCKQFRCWNWVPVVSCVELFGISHFGPGQLDDTFCICTSYTFCRLENVASPEKNDDPQTFNKIMGWDSEFSSGMYLPRAMGV